MVDSIRDRVLEILKTETHAGALSDKLFSPQGLLAQVAKTKEQRSELIQDPLYRQAMARFSALQRSEAARFAEELHNLPDKSPVQT